MTAVKKAKVSTVISNTAQLQDAVWNGDYDYLSTLPTEAAYVRLGVDKLKFATDNHQTIAETRLALAKVVSKESETLRLQWKTLRKKDEAAKEALFQKFKNDLFRVTNVAHDARAEVIFSKARVEGNDQGLPGVVHSFLDLLHFANELKAAEVKKK